MTVREHLKVTMKLLGERVTSEKLEKLGKRVGLLNRIDYLVKNLSAGYKRKLSIGIALIGNPRLLILDEPTSNLDLSSREMIWKVIT